MLRITDRYIFRQVLSGTISAVVLLSVVLVLSQVFKEIRPLLVEQEAPLLLLLKFVFLLLPYSLLYTLPWGFLSAILLTFGRLSAENEILVIRTTGQSLTRVALPILVLGLIFSGINYWISSERAPKAKDGIRTLLYDVAMAKKDPSSLLSPGMVQTRFPGKRIFVEGKGDGSLKGVHIYQLNADILGDLPASYVRASKAFLEVNQKTKQLQMRLDDVWMETQERGKHFELIHTAHAEPWIIDFSGAEKKKRMKPSQYTSRQIREVLKNEEFDEVAKRSFRMEQTRRIFTAGSCFVFAMVGIPLGISKRRKESNNALIGGIILAAVYFGFIVFADESDKISESFQKMLYIMPNALLFTLGCLLFKRASHR